jgi:acetolactate synthase-1/2/3 large subunit
MYTVQSLWTQARENLDVTTVIFSNRAYAILRVELSRTGAKDLMAEGDTKALSMFDLSNPNIDWVKMAEAMGVEAVRVSTLEDFSSAFQSAMKQQGPRLVAREHNNRNHTTNFVSLRLILVVARPNSGH